MNKPSSLDLIVIAEAEPRQSPDGANLGIEQSEENLKRISGAAERLSKMLKDSIGLTFFCPRREDRPSSFATAEEFVKDPWIARHVAAPPIYGNTALSENPHGRKDLYDQVMAMASTAVAKTPAGKETGMVLIGGPVLLGQIPELTPVNYECGQDQNEFVSINRSSLAFAF